MHCMLYSTVGTEEEAVKLAKHLLDKRLIACVNIFKIRSLYKWRGEMNDETEFAIIMKTRKDCAKMAIEEAARVHPYEVPCLVSYDMSEGLPKYLEWIDTETRPP